MQEISPVLNKQKKSGLEAFADSSFFKPKLCIKQTKDIYEHEADAWQIK